MTITIKAKPLEIKAELPGYGIFYLRRLGAAQEAEIRARLDEAKKLGDDIATKYKNLADEESNYIAAKNEGKLAELRASEDYQNCQKEQKEASEKMNDAINYLNKCRLKLWRAESPEAMERMLNDFTTEEINGFYEQVMEEANKNA